MVAPVIAAVGSAVLGGARVAAAGGAALARGAGVAIRAASGAIARGGAAFVRGAKSAGSYVSQRLSQARTSRGAIETVEELMQWGDEYVMFEMNMKAMQIYNEAVKNTPVVTGHLQRSWKIKLASSAKDIPEIWNEASYYPYVEYDTAKSRGKYILANATARVMG